MNRGWSLQEMMGMILVLMICLVIIAIVANSKLSFLFANTETNTLTYETLENRVVTALKDYEIKYYGGSLDSGELIVKISTLQSEKILDDLIDKSANKCTGYGKIVSANDTETYTAYIKCGNDYRTTGYEE